MEVHMDSSSGSADTRDYMRDVRPTSAFAVAIIADT